MSRIKGHLFITADHGNADQMRDPKTGDVQTAHTLNPVPFVYVGPYAVSETLDNGKLSDVAPTILNVMGVEQPQEMTGHSIFKFQ